jgi:hypothetical protein
VHTRPAVKLIVFGIAAAVFLVVLAVRHAVAYRRTQSLRRLAAERGLIFEAGPRPVEQGWVAFGWSNASNVITGSFRGRRFAAFDYGERSWISPGGSFSVVSIECEIPTGTPTAPHKKGFAPWRLELDAKRARAVNDAAASPDEVLAVLGEMSDVLDLIAPAPAS